MSDYPWQTDPLVEKGLRPYPSMIETRRNLMTERRPHWDSELVEAVTAILFDCYDNGISEAQAYAVIAAVEDHLKDYWKHEGDHA